MTRFPGIYPADWPEISARVKDEAHYRCVRCMHPEGDRMRPEDLDDFAYSGRMEGGERRRMVKLLVPCDTLCLHQPDGKLRMLTVHHLDGDKGNQLWWNLLALCQVCHLSIQSRVIVERPWILAHSEWFVPYVAGFYAHYHGGLTVTREEVMADPAKYLAMGQPHLFEVEVL